MWFINAFSWCWDPKQFTILTVYSLTDLGLRSLLKDPTAEPNIGKVWTIFRDYKLYIVSTRLCLAMIHSFMLKPLWRRCKPCTYNNVILFSVCFSCLVYNLTFLNSFSRMDTSAAQWTPCAFSCYDAKGFCTVLHLNPHEFHLIPSWLLYTKCKLCIIPNRYLRMSLFITAAEERHFITLR